MQRDYQHRVLICDRDDFTVLEIVEGKRVFPDEQILQKAAKESRQRGEMAMTWREKRTWERSALKTE